MNRSLLSCPTARRQTSRRSNSQLTSETSPQRPGWNWGFLFTLGLIALVGMAAHGCSRRDKPADLDYSALADLVIDLSDLALDDLRFRRQFASDKHPSPAQRQQYKQYLFKLAADPQVEGDSATLAVLVCNTEGERQVEWTAAREAGQWKLTSAPLK